MNWIRYLTRIVPPGRNSEQFNCQGIIDGSTRRKTGRPTFESDDKDFKQIAKQLEKEKNL